MTSKQPTPPPPPPVQCVPCGRPTGSNFRSIEEYVAGEIWKTGKDNAVGREDKNTRGVQVRVLALLENPRPRSSTRWSYSQKPRRDQVLDPARLQKPCWQRVLDGWFARLVNGHPRPRSMDREWNKDKDVHWWVAGASIHGSKWN